MNILDSLKSVFAKLTNWYWSRRGLEASPQEIEAFHVEQERQLQEAEREYQAYLAEWKAQEAERERENLEYTQLCESNELTREEQDRIDQEWEDHQRHYQSHCPHCGSNRVSGRCPACDRAFGRE